MPFMLESKKGVKVYNPQRVMCQFGYDQSTTVLTGELSTSSASVVEAKFIGHDSQILVGRERFSWPRLDRVGVRSSRGVLFWY